MTDGDDQTAVVQPGGATDATETTDTGNVPETADELFEYLSRNEKIFFKSQQIDDPELTADEKRSIAAEIYNASPKKFLLRFGKFLQRDHLLFFKLPTGSIDDEIRFIVADLMQSLKTRSRDVKNRRYAAMQAMIKADSYFSEHEMMKREPHLYEQLIGQYLTDAEKRLRDQLDVESTPFSRILLTKYDNEQMEDLRKQQEREDMSDDDDEPIENAFDDDQSTDDEMFPKLPASYRKQWGNFEDEPTEEPIKVAAKKPEREQKYITGAEREILRREFEGIMYAKFLDGDEKEFDYEAVDDNADLDDLEQIGQDNEDKYFDADDDDLDGIEQRIAERMVEDESEDELDVYMKNLGNHPTL